MTRWRNITGLPVGINLKIDIESIKDFRGYCDLTVVLTNNDAVFKEMKVEYTPWTMPHGIGGASTLSNTLDMNAHSIDSTSRKSLKGVPEPFMSKGGHK